MIEQDFIEPSASSRKKLLLLFTCMALIGGIWQFALMPYFFAFVKSLPPCDQFPWFRGILGVVVFSLPVIAVFWAIPRARKLLKYQQSPLPGAWVWRRTQVKRGAIVRWQAYVLLAWALLAMLFPIWAWKQVDTSLATPIKCTTSQHAPSEPSLAK